MNQLNLLKELLESPPVSDDLLEFYLGKAEQVICDIRNSNVVEDKYKYVQVEMAIELFNKRGAEGQDSHSENGINRGWETAEISDALLAKVTPFGKTIGGEVRVVDDANAE